MEGRKQHIAHGQVLDAHGCDAGCLGCVILSGVCVVYHRGEARLLTRGGCLRVTVGQRFAEGGLGCRSVRLAVMVSDRSGQVSLGEA